MGIQRLARALSRLVEALVGLMLGSVLVLALAEVVARYFVGHSLVWVAEINRYVFVWLTFLSAAVAFHHRMHFRVVFLWKFIGPGTRARLELAVDAATIAFALVLLVQSLGLVARTSEQRSPALLIPMSYIYSVVPLAAVLILVFILLRWAELFRTRRLPDPSGREH